MTTTVRPLPQRPPSLLLHPIKHMRAKLPPPIVMPNGKVARVRLLQTTLWSGIIAVCAAALVAGVYFNVIEVNWHIFWLKAWWDGTAPYHGGLGGLIRTANWVLYRHGYRDQGEPEVATFIVGTLIAKRKTWGRRAPIWYMLFAPFLLLALSGVGITVLVWLLNVGIPRWTGVAQLNHWYLFLGTFAGGLVLGHLIRPIWAPVGSTINGWYIDWSVDRFLTRRSKRNKSKGPLKAPLWVRHWFLAPLPMRERWMWQLEHNTAIRSYKALPKWVLHLLMFVATFAVFALAYFVVTGGLAHFWIGHGHSVPFLAPAGQ